MNNKADVIAESIKAIPPASVSLATLAGVPLHDIVMLATLVYIVLQAAFLLWKWWKMAIGDVDISE